MATSSEQIKETALRLKEVEKELHHLNKRVRELRAERKELSEILTEYLGESGKTGVKVDNVVFEIKDKSTRARKKKSDVVKDVTEVLKGLGLDDNDAKEAFERIEEARRGEESQVSTVKLKAALFD